MELDKVVVKKPLRQTLAAAVSAIVHPVAFPLLTLGAITYTQTSSMRQALIVCLVALVTTTAPVAGLVAYQVARGHWTDFDVSVREQRYKLYPVGLIFVAAAHRHLLLDGCAARHHHRRAGFYTGQHH